MMWQIVMFVFLFVITTDCQREMVHLVAFLPKTGSWPIGRTIAPAAILAAHDVNANRSFLPNQVLHISYHETGCNQGRALWKLIDEFTSERHIDGIIGDGCDSICTMFGLFASQIDLPIISWGCKAVTLSNKQEFPTFARTVGSRETMLDAALALFDAFNWKRFTIVVVSDGSWDWVTKALNEDIEVHGRGTIQDIHTFPPGSLETTEDEFEHRSETLHHLLEEVKILILFANGGDIRKTMLLLLDLDKIDGETAFVAMDLNSEVVYGVNTWMGDDGRDEDAIRAFQGLINIYIKKPNTEEYQQFEERVQTTNAKPPFSYEMSKGETVDVHAGLLYDAVLLYSHALQDALDQGYNLNNPSHISRLMFNRTFTGMSGEVHIDNYGDHRPIYAVQIFNGEKFVDFGEYSYEQDAVIMYDDVKVVFPGGRTEIPRDSPECGWENELCQSASGISKVTLISIIATSLGALLLCSVAAAVMYRKITYEAEVNSEALWRIRFHELHVLGDNSCRASGVSVRKNAKQDTLSQHSDGMQQVFHDRASYKGIIVCLTNIPGGEVFVDREFLVSIKQARELHHENINPFIGLCIDQPHTCIVTSYAARGSLQDVLENDNINISADFKLSFMMDICKAIEYLHRSAIDSHGHLKSSDCVIDNRWVCKVTDFGLEQLRVKERWTDEHRRYSALLWTAPELLRNPNRPPGGTKRGDVYSFGIIIQEIVTRTRPYSEFVDKEPKDIVGLVQVLQDPPFRPELPKDACPGYMCDIMQQCWAEEAETRPSFTSIKKKFKDANAGKDLNILDNMIHMMEQYANHLEEIVSDRTQQLEDEKKKTDELLYQMLPRPVADALKLGRMIEPEAYDKSTVYFSDIVGFTKMASSSTPLEVITFLNDLYSAFDAIIESHDVYKVETIGDAYMVVSGIPIKNGNNHAGAVASMSLDILSCITMFRIRHMPDARLQLRIGIHSGPAAAGVVGLKMPRYCLFGDTVNTASRMESNGLPLRIHVSKTTKLILDELGGYITQERGKIDIKGKGQMTTYWLITQENYSKPLPVAPDDVSNFSDKVHIITL